MEKIDVVKHILRHVSYGRFVNDNGGYAWAPSNVALIKYWGKRDDELNLPVTSSLSLSLGDKGAYTEIRQEEAGREDVYKINGGLIASSSKFAKRLKSFLDLFRPPQASYRIDVSTNIPIAAGFASSACGFASLVLALNNLYDWRLNKRDLSILARLGSGSACRSVENGFVVWQQGERIDGMDSYAVKLDSIWPDLRLGMLAISLDEKLVSSREAMRFSVTTSSLYANWPNQVAHDWIDLKLAIAEKDFVLFGQTAENNARAMHAVMQASMPPVFYSVAETAAAVAKIHQLRALGVPIFFTQDAGPNLQLMFLAEDETEILRVFPELDVVLPFVDPGAKKIILVNEKDIESGVGEKIAVHIQGQLHRAFSVVVLRERNGVLEMLLQQRSAVKYHSANLWSNACCGHPMPGENITQAAEKRLREEMGFSVALEEIGQFHYRAKFSEVGLIENELDHVFIGFSELEEFPFNPEEVQDYCWIDINLLKNELQMRPDKYTVWLSQVVNLLLVCYSTVIGTVQSEK